MGPKSGRRSTVRRFGVMQRCVALASTGKPRRITMTNKQTNRLPSTGGPLSTARAYGFRAHKIDRVGFAERDRIAHHQRRVGDLNACSACTATDVRRKPQKVGSGCWDSGRFMAVGNSDGSFSRPPRLYRCRIGRLPCLAKTGRCIRGWFREVPHRSWGAISLAG